MWNYIQGVKNPAENVERKAELKEYFNDYERKRARKISLKWTDNRPWLVSTTNGMTCTWNECRKQYRISKTRNQVLSLAANRIILMQLRNMKNLK